MIGFILGLIAGLASPTQASVNLKIREYLHSAYITTLLNFISAGIILALFILATERSLYIPLAAIAEQPFWIWLGGPCGTVIILLNVICLPKLGSARNMMLLCFGQIMTGLLIDNFGLFGSMQIPMGIRRFIGAALVIAGIALVNGISRPGRTSVSSADINAGEEGKGSGSAVIYIVLAIISGASCASQVAINGTLSLYSGTAAKATLVSMCAGLLATAILIILIAILKGEDGLYDGGNGHGQVRLRPWMPAGGVLAIVIVGGNAIAAPVLGTGIVTILNLIGMMAGGLAIDATGFLGIEKKPVTAVKVAGMLFMVTGAAFISF